MNEKRAASARYLIGHGIPVHPNLPELEMLQPRSAADVARRIAVLYALAGLAYDEVSGKSLKNWLVGDGVWPYVAADERSLFDREHLSKAETNELGWNEESLFALCWAGGLVSSLDVARPRDLNPLFDHIPSAVPMDEFLASFKLRSADAIGQMLDTYYCLHAAFEHPELWDEEDLERSKTPEESTGVPTARIVARRQALEWLMSPGLEWHEVSLDT